VQMRYKSPKNQSLNLTSAKQHIGQSTLVTDNGCDVTPSYTIQFQGCSILTFFTGNIRSFYSGGIFH